MKIFEPVTLIDFCLGGAPNEAGVSNLIFSERGGRSLQEMAGDPGNQIYLFVASEGGWSRREMETAEAYHFFPVSLGPRILRSETAGLVAVTLAQFLLGDMKKTAL